MNPDTAFETVWRAFEAADGHKVAALSTEESLQRYHYGIMDALVVDPELPTLEEYIAEASPLPREVAEQKWQLMQQYYGKRIPLLLGKFDGTRSVEELRALPPAEVLARAMRSLSPQLRSATHIPGWILEGTDRAFVLFRLHWKIEGDYHATEPPEVASLRLVNGEWRLELDTVLWGMPGYSGFATQINEDDGSAPPMVP